MSIPPPPQALAADEIYVFICYARQDQAVAEQVEAFLTAAGVRVFRDQSAIGVGDNWDEKIEQALRECQGMVLLLSPASMQERKEEVHREWFNFDQKGKPIYPLLILDCNLHSRFVSRQYEDARLDLPGALERLLKKLRQDFALPPLAPSRPLPEALQSLYDVARDPAGTVALSVDQANAVNDHQPANLTEYRLRRIAEWSLPRYYLDKRFVNLTLIVDKGENEPQRWQKLPAEEFRFNDLRDVLEKTKDDPALVLLGAPGSGKSTLLRRLQLDHSVDRLRDEQEEVSFFIQLNGYSARSLTELPQPREWLNTQWAELYPKLPPLEDYLRAGRVLLLLDALNEMPHKSSDDYFYIVELWKTFAQEAARQGNRLIFTCRSLDYGAWLSGPGLRVPQVEVQPLNKEQIQDFLKAYIAAYAERVWDELGKSPRQLELYRTPYFLSLLCEHVEATGGVIPQGRAALFTSFVRRALKREKETNSALSRPSALLVEKDHQMLSSPDRKLGPFDLPERGVLVSKLSGLAFSMQEKGLETEGAQVRIDYVDACGLIAQEGAEFIIAAGVALNVLDEERDKIAFFHQLLQEYFAARRLAKEPHPALVHVEWEAERVSPALADTLAGLADGDPLPPQVHSKIPPGRMAIMAGLAHGDPLPPLRQTGWEETTLTAAPMAADPQAFIGDLVPYNLPLAGRCAAAPEISISGEFERELQQALIARTQDKRADLRARIAAGEALGLLGDPRFELCKGPYGAYLLPPLVEIPGGTYPMGDDQSDYADEKPAHAVDLGPFEIGQFPVTNAEYKHFIEADGYRDEEWWDTQEALAWLRGEATSEGRKQQWRDNRKTLLSQSEESIRGLVRQNRIAPEKAERWIEIRNYTDERLDQHLDEWFPAGRIYRQPEYWDDARFNNPAQPVVGVTWFEARAYCNWLTANALQAGTPGASNAEKIFRLPTEAEFEAAARGKTGRLFPYGDSFEVSRSNTFESHIRRTTPVGVFENATPEGAFDLSGNVYTWALSIYDQEQFPYPYRSEDGRDDVHRTDVRRLLRGGSWDGDRGGARAVYRYNGHRALRDDGFGFRLVGSRAVSS